MQACAPSQSLPDLEAKMTQARMDGFARMKAIRRFAAIRISLLLLTTLLVEGNRTDQVAANYELSLAFTCFCVALLFARFFLVIAREAVSEK